MSDPTSTPVDGLSLETEVFRMGPTNIALVKLYRADQDLRAAQEKLDAATKNVRIQERRAKDVAEKLQTQHQKLKETQASGANLELDIKSRDARIEKLRTQQQNAKNNKEYQAFLVEINTEKLDKGKIEEQTLVVMETIEKLQKEVADLTAQSEGESAKLATMKAEIDDTIKKLTAEVDSLRPAREEAAAATPAKALQAFERIVDHMDGEALAPISKPDKRREEYICGGCHMDLVADMYNRLHVRDDITFCPNCRRILYIPDDLPPDKAVHKKKAIKEPKGKGNIAAVPPRQQSAADVLNSIQVEQDPPAMSPSDEVPQSPSNPEPEAPANLPNESTQQT
jgi:predicted  nucleic acid-binding Zn-ribbon protein